MNPPPHKPPPSPHHQSPPSPTLPSGDQEGRRHHCCCPYWLPMAQDPAPLPPRAGSHDLLWRDGCRLLRPCQLPPGGVLCRYVRGLLGLWFRVKDAYDSACYCCCVWGEGGLQVVRWLSQVTRGGSYRAGRHALHCLYLAPGAPGMATNQAGTMIPVYATCPVLSQVWPSSSSPLHLGTLSFEGHLGLDSPLQSLEGGWGSQP